MYSFGIIMDPIQDIDITKDSTIAIIESLQKSSKIFYTSLSVMMHATRCVKMIATSVVIFSPYTRTGFSQI